MDSALTKATTLLFLVATFCLAGIALAEDDDLHPVTPPVHPPDDSRFSPSPPLSVDPPADSPFSPPSPTSIDPLDDSPVSPLLTPLVDPLADSPVSPPLHPPVDPPADSPVSPPLPPSVNHPAQLPVPRFPEPSYIVVITGDVFCQSCRHAGSEDLTGASPINGAVVKIQCKINETVVELIASTTYRYGYFIMRRVYNTSDIDNCNAYLFLSPTALCNIPTDLHGGLTGGKLKRDENSNVLFKVEPFAFLPNCN